MIFRRKQKEESPFNWELLAQLSAENRKLRSTLAETEDELKDAKRELKSKRVADEVNRSLHKQNLRLREKMASVALHLIKPLPNEEA
jgi:uncharacterized protein YdcH (DUF465 family)